MRIAFFGTPAFAAASLRALLDSTHSVVGVISQPDRPQGRSRSTLVPSAVTLEALEAGIPVLQPERPVGDLFAAALRRLEADIGVVVAYGHILRPEILSIPARGMLNVHASLLPKLRGAAPIPWAIAHGEPETGVSVMRMTPGMDEGPVYLRVATPIADDDTSGTLATRLAALGGRALIDALDVVESGQCTPEPQQHELATYAPKLSREIARVDWSAPARVVANRIRAFEPAPGAWSCIGAREFKLFGARPVAMTGEPGRVTLADGRLVVGAGNEAVEIAEVQPAGRKRVSAADWLRGHGASEGDLFE